MKILYKFDIKVRNRQLNKFFNFVIYKIFKKIHYLRHVSKNIYLYSIFLFIIYVLIKVNNIVQVKIEF